MIKVNFEYVLTPEEFKANRFCDYGQFQWGGKTLKLQDEADYTGRYLSQEGCAEFSCRAVDSEGNEYRIYWIHEVDEDTELDSLDWTNADRIVPA